MFAWTRNYCIGVAGDSSIYGESHPSCGMSSPCHKFHMRKEAKLTRLQL